MNEFEDKVQNFSDLVKQAAVEQQQKEEADQHLEVEQADQGETEHREVARKQPSIQKNATIPEPKTEDFQPVSEVGVISTATTITGTVSSKGHVRIEGNLIGDIFAYGDIKVTGGVTGDIEGGNVELEGSKVTGNTLGRGDIAVGKDTVISGDVNGQLITVDGKIEGNIIAHKGAHLASTAMVKGSVSASTMSMSSGAVLMGKVDVAKDEK